MSEYLKADNNLDFGKRNGRIIPGLKRTKLSPFKSERGSELQLFTGGQYEKNGVNGGFIGLRGDVPLKNSRLEVYGGVGNIAAAGAKYSYNIWQNDNFSFKGYARTEGAISFTDKKRVTINNSSSFEKGVYAQNSIVSECPAEVVITDGYQTALSESGYETTLEGYNFNTIYHKTYLEQNYNINADVAANINTDLYASNFKTAIGGELTYTNDRGNLDISISGEVGVKSNFSVNSKYNPNVIVKTDADLLSANSNDDAHVTLNGNNDVYIPGRPNLQTKESIRLAHSVNIGGFENSLGLESSLYGVFNGSVNYRAGKFQLGGEAGIQYSNKQFTPTFKAELSYLLGNSPKLYNRSPLVLGKKLPFYDGPLYTKPNYYLESNLNLFVRGQAINDVNGFAVGLEGNFPLNNLGTELNVSAGVGNIITADINISQTNPITNDKWTLKNKFGIGLNYSLTNKNTSTEEVPLYDKRFEYYVNDNILEYEYNFHHEYTIDEIYSMISSNTSAINKNSMKLYGGTNICYKPIDKFEINIGIEGGYKGSIITAIVDNVDSLTDVHTNYDNKDACDFPNNHYQMIQNHVHWDNYSSIHTMFTTDDIRVPEYGFEKPGYYVTNNLGGDTQIDIMSKYNSTITYTPKLKPYIKVKAGAQYNFDNKNSLKGEVSYDGKFGGFVTYTRKLK